MKKWIDRQSKVKEVNGRETCVGRKPVSNESSVLVGLGEFYFHLVVKLWYFDVNRFGLVCFKVTECTFSV